MCSVSSFLHYRFRLPRAHEPWPRRVSLSATRSATQTPVQSWNDALTGTIGGRRACTISMISPLSMPWR